MAKRKAKAKGRKPSRKKASRRAPARSPAASVSPPEKSPRRKSGGRPRFCPTEEHRKSVAILAGLGLRHEEICLLVENPKTGKPIDDKTLRRHFRHELDSGPAKLNAQVGQSIVRKAIGDGPQAVTAAIWYSKCRMGWKERSVIEVDTKSGVLVPPAEQTPEQWIATATARAAKAKEPGAEDEET